MISMRHECLVDLFKNRSSLAAELLVEALGIALPDFTEARVASVALNETQPADGTAHSWLLPLPLLYQGFRREDLLQNKN